jgi:hypothetical protein
VNGIPYVHLVYEGDDGEAISVVVGRRYQGLSGRLRAAVRVVSEGTWGVVNVRRDDGSEVHVVARPSAAARIAAAFEAGRAQ